MAKLVRDIEAAAAHLRSGGLVAFPTETVYGLGALAEYAPAVAKVFAYKNRPTNHPLIIHVQDFDHVAYFAREVSADAKRLIDAFTPGPMTLIFHRVPSVAAAAAGGAPTVAIRAPSHPVARQLLAALGGAEEPSAIAAPSANPYGYISATRAEQVMAHFAPYDEIWVLDGDDGAICGIESCIVDVSSALRIIRPGIIGNQTIEQTLGQRLPVFSKEMTAPVASPGTTLRHYSPRTPSVLVNPHQAQAQVAHLRANGIDAVGALSSQQPSGVRCWYYADPDPVRYAGNLYYDLWRLDNAGCDHLIIEPPAGLTIDREQFSDITGDIELAILDRLTRAVTAADEAGLM